MLFFANAAYQLYQSIVERFFVMNDMCYDHFELVTVIGFELIFKEFLIETVLELVVED